MGDEPRPRSPPGYVDLYGKRSQEAKLHVLEREITYLQEELKSLEVAQPTSRCCKELNEFLATKPDPLISIQQKASETDCSWKIISGCCQSDDSRHHQVKSSRCCCSTKSSCLKYCGLKECSCFNQKCCSFKMGCSSNCCKVRLCPNSVINCFGSCCLSL